MRSSSHLTTCGPNVRGALACTIQGSIHASRSRCILYSVTSGRVGTAGRGGPPVARTEADFDAAAKYHVAANVPYMRYFLADILQFQFHRALSQIAGCHDLLNRCSIYDNKEAGRRLNNMLTMGLSHPWQDAMFELTGQRQMDATAILDYFAPLQKWLDEQNKGKQVGWKSGN